MFETLFKTFVLDVQTGRVKPIWYVWAGFSIFMAWVFFWWSIGMMPTEAFGDGFAKKEDVKAVLAGVQELRRQSLEAVILDRRLKQCTAQDAQTRQMWTSFLQQSRVEYRTLKGEDYPLPECADLVAR